VDVHGAVAVAHLQDSEGCCCSMQGKNLFNITVTRGIMHTF
jgi:hypothetical protein